MTAQVYWLLDLEFAGQTLRLSTAELDVDSDDGELHYTAALQAIELSEAIELLDAQLSEANVNVDAVLPVDVPALVAAGYRLEGCVGSLALWRAGQTYEERRVRLVGMVRDPEYGAKDEPVSFSLSAEVWISDAVVPPLGHEVSSSTWPDSWSASYPTDGTMDTFVGSLTPDDLGLVYPVVFGRPGRTTGLAYPVFEGAIGAHVSRDLGDRLMSGGAEFGYAGPYVVIAGHRVMSESVYAYTESVSNETFDYYDDPADPDPAFNGFRVEHWTDAVGNTVAVLVGHGTDNGGGDVPIGSSEANSLGSTQLINRIADNSFRSSDDGNGGTLYVPVYVGWYDHTRSDEGGGMVGEDGELVRGAGDVLTYLLRQTGMRVDAGRCAAAASLLNSFKIDCAIDERTKIWEWLQANLLPILPVSIATGPEGIYVVVWRYNATAADATLRLDADEDPTVQRASRVKVDSSRVTNQFRFNFCVNRRTGQAMQYRGLDATYNADEPSVRASYLCAVSQARYRSSRDSGVRPEEITSSVIWDVATADAILAVRARAYALARRTVDYIVSGSEYDDVERGDVVLLTDTEIGIVDQLAIVREVQVDGSGAYGVSLLIIEDPARDNL